MSMNQAIRDAVQERLQSRSVRIEAKTLRLGQAIQYQRLNGGRYVGIVTRIFPRRGEVKATFWTEHIHHRDGTYGRRANATVLRSEVVHESQIIEVIP